MLFLKRDFTLFGAVCLQGILGGGAPSPPPVVAPPVMPVQNSAAIAAAKQKQLSSMYAQSGRQSTILTDDNDKFGG